MKSTHASSADARGPAAANGGLTSFPVLACTSMGGNQMHAAFNAKRWPSALAAAQAARELALTTYGAQHAVYAAALNNVALMHKVRAATHSGVIACV